MDAYGKIDDPYFFLSLIAWFNLGSHTVLLLTLASVSVFNDGSSRDLMSLTGTIPVSYRGRN